MINELIFYEEPFDYFTEASKQVGYDVSQSAVMVGGLPYFHYPVALIPDDSGTVSGLVPVVAPIMVPDGLAKSMHLAIIMIFVRRKWRWNNS